MTRAYAQKPAWTWVCDRCGRTSGDLAHTSAGLPSADEMRARGWFIADLYGDLCSRCKEGADS